MKSRIKTSGITVICLIVLLIAIAGSCLYQIHHLKKEQQVIAYQAEALYQRNFGELTTSVQAMNEQLAQLLVTTSQNRLLYGLSDLWREVYSAISFLGSLPIAMHELEQTDLLLHDIAEYSYYLMQKTVLNHVPLDTEDWNQLEDFYLRSGTIQKELETLTTSVLSEDFRLAAISIQDENNPVSTAFRSIETQVSAFPKIVFSEGVRKMASKPRPIQGSPVSESAAIIAANQFIQILQPTISTDRLKGKLSFIADTASIPIYGIAYPNQSYIEVSQTGGCVLQYYHSKELQSATLTADQAKTQAKQILQRLGFHDMMCIETSLDDNTANFIFVPLQDNVYLYPDMVKLQLALDDGTLLSFDQTSYLTCHHQRNLPSPQFTQEEILQNRNPNFKVSTVYPALITDEYSTNELLTYEIRGSIIGENFSIFVDAQTGEEVRIVRL